MGQAVPQMGESEVLPHVHVMDHEPGKVSRYIDDDPGGKAHEKAQREAQKAPSPKHLSVVPEPKPQQGQEGQPVDVGEPEPEPRREAQEHGVRQRGLLLREHFEQEKHGQRREKDRLRMKPHGGHGEGGQQRRRETEQEGEVPCHPLAGRAPDGLVPEEQREREQQEWRELQGEHGRPEQQEEAGSEGPDHQRAARIVIRAVLGER